MRHKAFPCNVRIYPHVCDSIKLSALSICESDAMRCTPPSAFVSFSGAKRRLLLMDYNVPCSTHQGKWEAAAMPLYECAQGAA
jgi:hypothetical protein